MRAVPDAAVVAWLDRQPADSVWITSITLFEARFGLALLRLGRRRQTLEAAFASLLKEDLENRVLDFDSAAATEAASLAAMRRKTGRPVDMRDTTNCGHCTGAACGSRYPKRSALFGSRHFYC